MAWGGVVGGVCSAVPLPVWAGWEGCFIRIAFSRTTRRGGSGKGGEGGAGGRQGGGGAGFVAGGLDWEEDLVLGSYFPLFFFFFLFLPLDLCFFILFYFHLFIYLFIYFGIGTGCSGIKWACDMESHDTIEK